MLAPAETHLHDARVRRDPTRTYKLRARLRAEGDRRWRLAAQTLRQALIEHDLVGLRGMSKLPYGDKTEGFGLWLAEELRQKVLGFDGSWMRPYIQEAANLAQRHAAEMTTTSAAIDPSRVAAMQSIAVSELKGITAAAQQQLTRVVAHCLMTSATPHRCLAGAAGVVKTMRNRTRTMADYIVIKMHATATLSALRSAGVTHVGTVAERLQPRTRQTAHGRVLLDKRRSIEEGEDVDVVTAGDDVVCTVCEEISDGGPYELDEAEGLIPAHPYAVLEGSTIASYGAMHEMVRAKFRGPAVYLRTHAKILAIGPYHPMLTRRGWLRAYEIREGDELVYDLRADLPNAGAAGEPYFEEMPLTENVFEAFSLVSRRITARTGHDLHGDRSFCQGEVDVVYPTRQLLPVFDSSDVEQFREFFLVRSYVETALKSCLRFGDAYWKRFFSAAASIMRGGNLEFALISGHTRPLETFLLRSTTQFNRGKFERLHDHPPASAVPFSQCQYTGSSAISASDSCLRWDRVLSVHVREFSGWAFDATTATGIYNNSGYVVKNCRCAFTPLSDARFANVREFDARWFDKDQPRYAPGEISPHGGEFAPEGGAVYGDLVASRNVTSKKAAAQGGFAQPDVASMRLDPENYAHDVGLFGNAHGYPNFRAGELRGSPDERVQTIIEHMKSNLKFIYDNTDSETRSSGMVWYDRTHDIAAADAKQFGLDDRSAAAAYAAMSPQKDWNENIYLSHRIIEINATQKDFRWDKDMDKVAGKIWALKPGASPLRQRIVVLMESTVKNARLGDLTDPAAKAIWIRTYDEAHSNRNYTEFDTGKLAMNKPIGKRPAEPSKAAWPSIDIIAGAVAAVDSKGDMKVISEALGEKHKVRSFYNNIVDPHDAHGDVTIDTHAVGAALLRSLSGADTAVMHNLATSPKASDKSPGWKAASMSTVTGIKGTYGIYADAYREAAKEIGIEPQQLQAVVWQAKRKMFDLSDEKLGRVEKEWVGYRKGRQDLAQTQNNVLNITRELE